MRVKGCYINQADNLDCERSGEWKPKRVQERSECIPSVWRGGGGGGRAKRGPRPSFELTRERTRRRRQPSSLSPSPSRHFPARALQCSLIYGPGAHTQSYTRYHNTINSSSNSPLTESYWPRSKSRGATNVSATSALRARCFISFEPRGQVNL